MTPSKGELKRLALLETAEQVLVTAGNADATMRTFAAAANVSVGHLQHYFPTRADLMQAVLDRVLHRSLAWIRDTTGIDVERDNDAPLTREESGRIASSLMQQQSDPATVRLYVEIWAIAAADETIAAVLREFYTQYAQCVELVIKRAQPALDPGSLRAKAGALVAIFEGSVIASAGFVGLRSPGTDDELLSTITGLIHGV